MAGLGAARNRKTTVLKRAIGDLTTRGKRVLLVSATNIAVDNALWGVVKERRHSDGEIVRVGPPHLREVAEDASVCLTLMVRERLADADEQRRAVAAQLVDARERARRLKDLERSLTGFDAAAYAADRARLDDPARTSEALTRVRDQVRHEAHAAGERIAQLEQARTTAADEVRATEQAQADWAAHEEVQAQFTEMREAVTGLETKALLTEGRRDAAEQRLSDLEQLKGFSKRRAKKDLATAQSEAEKTRHSAEEAEQKAANARDVLARTQQQLGQRIADLRARILFSKEEIEHRQRSLHALTPAPSNPV